LTGVSTSVRSEVDFEAGNGGTAPGVRRGFVGARARGMDPDTSAWARSMDPGTGAGPGQGGAGPGQGGAVPGQGGGPGAGRRARGREVGRG
jgi:hypothetical protein